MSSDDAARSASDLNLNFELTDADLPTLTVAEGNAGDVLLPYSMPQAEYMCGCVATSVGMLLGYYDLYGCTVNGLKYDFSKLVPGTISIISRGSDGGSIYDMTDPSVLALFIASPEYNARFYKQTEAHEKPYTFVDGDPSKGLNLSAWNCLADYLGTGQYWRGLGDLSTGHYDASLEWLNRTTLTYPVTGTLNIPVKWHDFKYGLSLYLDTIGYELDERHTYTVDAEDYTFSDLKVQIDAGHPVLISMKSSEGGGHMVIAYGYNAGTNEIIFDDTYRANCRMTWGGSYYYASSYYDLSAFSVVTLKTDEAHPAVEVYRGYVPVSSGSFISGKTLGGAKSETRMYVNRGGSASMMTLGSGGLLYVSQGGSVINVTANSSGFIYAYSGGVVSSAVLNSSSYAYISGGSFRYTVINSSGVLRVSSNGIADSSTVNSSGYLIISNGGVARVATVNGGNDRYGYLLVSNGGIASSAIANGGGMFVYTGGAAISAGVKSGGFINLSNGGMMMSTVVSSRGYMYVSNGGMANSLLVSSGGSMEVKKGGVANSVTVLRGGHAVISGGGTVNGLTVSSGGEMYVCDSAEITGKVTLASGSLLWMYAGGIFNFDLSRRTVYAETLLNDITRVQSNPTFVVTVSASDQTNGTYKLAGNAASFSRSITVKNESGTTLGTISVGGSFTKNGSTYMLNTSGGILTLKITGGNTISGAINVYNTGMMLVSAADTLDGKGLKTTGDDVRMYVRSGGMARATTVSSGGSMVVSRGGMANFTQILNSGLIIVSSGGVVSNTTISSGAYGGSMTVYKDGTVLRTVASSVLRLSSGTADETVVERGGKMYVSGGFASRTTVNSSGNFYVYSRGWAEATTVNSSGHMYVSNSGFASRTTVNNYGSMCICSGAVASVTSVGNYGIVHVSGGGTAIDNTVASNGFMYVSSGGKITGKISLENGANISAYAGSVVDFNLSGVAIGEAVRINNLGRVFGSPTYTLTVADSQAFGEYLLAGGAAGFDKSITVKNFSGGTLGTLSAGKKINGGNYSYRLTEDDSLLWLTVGVAKAAGSDLNNDCRGDIIMTITQTGHAAYGATGAWLIQADQTAAWGDLSQRNSGWSIFGTGITTAGKTTNDVYVKSADNVVGAWVTNAAGAVTGWETVGQFDATTQVLGLGDFNGDGQTDLLLRNTNGAVGCYFTSGDKLGWNYFQSLGDEWTVSAIGDLNGDGRDDVVLKHDNGFAGSWLTQSDYTMAWANLDTLADGFTIVGCGDFDGDGTSDVLLKNGGYYGAWIVEDGSVSSWMGLGGLGSVSVEQIADFDADGVDDLRIRTAMGDLGSQLVKGADSLEWKYYGSVGSEWSTSLAAI